MAAETATRGFSPSPALLGWGRPGSDPHHGAVGGSPGHPERPPGDMGAGRLSARTRCGAEGISPAPATDGSSARSGRVGSLWGAGSDQPARGEITNRPKSALLA